MNMETTPEKHMHLRKHFVIKAAVGFTMLSVRYQDLELFLEIAGELILAEGDSREEAIKAFEARQTWKRSTRRERTAILWTLMGNRIETEFDNFIDWIRGRGWR